MIRLTEHEGLSRETVRWRLAEDDLLNTEVAAWQRQRNASGARIKWKFTTERARSKLARAYPNIAKESTSL
jgi:hypothetical protein